eukprot:TRINITY_DN33812_c0_g1_i1.p1 TRINITY_DN33812_c0_g1~~TRINITY_DN33812_c0_g1_i1.p1  ORF type:complete len:122 (+),score=27.35 TRINITY_DN33812_c0_g1_i1:41-367(+)
MQPSTTPPVATSSASTTQTTEQSDPQQQPQQLVLRLHPKKERPRVSWDSSVKDSRSNMKTSKKCCVFHKRREFGESDSESCSSGDEQEKRDRPTRCTRKSCVCNTTYN